MKGEQGIEGRGASGRLRRRLARRPRGVLRRRRHPGGGRGAVVAATLLPFARYVTSRTGIRAQYQTGDRVVASFTRRSGGEPSAVDVAVASGRFHGGVVDLVLAALPLEEGFEADLPMLGTSGGADDLREMLEVRVEGRDTVPTPDGLREGWRVRLRRSGGSRQVMWIGREAPHLLRREVLDAEGRFAQRWERVGSG